MLPVPAQSCSAQRLKVAATGPAVQAVVAAGLAAAKLGMLLLLLPVQGARGSKSCSLLVHADLNGKVTTVSGTRCFQHCQH
jgi:hypothetical protein